MSGETAAIGLGFLIAGPVGAVVGGAALPVLVAASVWRARRREHDENTNQNQGNGAGNGSTNRDRSGSGGGRRNGNGSGAQHRSPNGPGGGRNKSPKGPGAGDGSGLGGGKQHKPKTKDPVADKLGKLGNGLADKLKNRSPKNLKNKDDKTGRNGKGTAAGADPKGPRIPKSPKAPRNRTDHSGSYPDDRRWRGRGHKDKPEKTKKDRNGRPGRGTSSTTAPDGLAPNGPNGGGLAPIEDRIQTVKERRERHSRRQAIKSGKSAERRAAHDGTVGDPLKVKLERIRTENQHIDLELHHVDQMLALAAATEQRRNTPVTYPVATTQPAGTRTAGSAVARQVDVRASTAYRLLVAMAEQLANGLHNDADADMADHVVELAGIPAMCRNLSVAVREAAATLQKTAPLHPSVVKHLNNASVAALTAARMADAIIIVFVSAHREDIFRVMQPRVGEERWNIRNAGGTLDAAKLRAAILASGQQRLALPAGSSNGTASNGSGKLVPASDASTKKLITLMKGFNRGHMVTCLSEVAGSASGVEIVADSVTKLYRRMANTWPTEDVVDDTVRATALKVKTIADELRKAVKAAQRAHARELKLNAKPRKGARSESKWDVAQGRKG